MRDPALMLFAKEPVPGAAKTRLMPRYTAAQSAQIAELLICETAKLAALNWTGEVYLCAAPSADHPLFRELARRFDMSLIDQGPGDLGARMQRAIADGVDRHGAAAVIGCDVPHCPHEILHAANTALARGANVLGATEDGGYYFIGLRRPAPELFHDIAWGTDSVYATTLARARGLGIAFEALPRLRDIDTAEDLAVVAETFEPLRRFL